MFLELTEKEDTEGSSAGEKLHFVKSHFGKSKEGRGIMFAILKREVKSLLSDGDRMVVYCSSSCTLWTIFLCLQSARRLSLYFLLTVGVAFIMLIAVPVLTMRSFAENATAEQTS